jgi:hypothetical protein
MGGYDYYTQDMVIQGVTDSPFKVNMLDTFG